MDKQEILLRESILADIKNDVLETMRLSVEINILKQELDLKKRELHKAIGLSKQKQKSASLTETEKKGLVKIANNPDTFEKICNQFSQRRAEVASKLKALDSEDATCLFDDPHNLQVTLVYKDRPVIKVDLIKSIKANVKNIEHPLVVQAIRRYLRAISTSHPVTDNQSKTGRKLSAKTAKENLGRLWRALISSGVRQQPEAKSFLPFMLALSKYPDGYFDTLWSFLSEASVKEARRGGTKVERIKLRLNKKYPDTDHQLVLDYLAHAFKDNSKVKLPQRGGGEALRNAVMGWEHEIEPQSVKVYLSEGRKWAENLVNHLPPNYDLTKLNLFSEKEFQEINDAFILDYLGIGHILPYEDLSNLITEEIPSDPKNEQ